MISLTPKVWSSRKHVKTSGLSMGAGAKHNRLVEDPDTGWIYNFGGDWADLLGEGSSQQQVYRYNVELDANTGNGAGWELVHQYCPPTGGVGPAGLDQGTVVYDSTRKLFWVIAGYMPWQPTASQAPRRLAEPLTAGGTETTISVQDSLAGAVSFGPRALIIINNNLSYEWITYTGIDTSVLPHKYTGCVRGVNGTLKEAHPIGEWTTLGMMPPCGITTMRASIPWAGFSFDPLTSQYTLRSKISTLGSGGTSLPRPFPTGEGQANGFYDEVDDAIYRMTTSTSGTIRICKFSLPTLAYTEHNAVPSISTGGNPAGNNDIAYDRERRIAYLLIPGGTARMVRHDLATNVTTLIGGTSTPPRTTVVSGSDGLNCYYPKFDPFNRVILWPFVQNFSTGNETNEHGGKCDLWVYHIDAGFGFPAATWEHPPLTMDSSYVDPIHGQQVPHANAWIFSEVNNCLLGMGRSATVDYSLTPPTTVSGGFINLYRYGATSTDPAFRPVGLSTSIR